MSRNHWDWFAQLRLLLLVVLALVVGTVVAEVLGDPFAYVLVFLVVALAFVGRWGWRKVLARVPDPVAVEETPPPPERFAPQPWHEPEPLCGRETEVAGAVWQVLRHGIVVVVGERDVGTSAVGKAVAQRLIDHHGVDRLVTHRFDLRGRSASTPDDALTIAAKVASAWHIAPPTEEATLEAVARELVGVFRTSGGTLLLDNVNTPDQVAWLVREWPAHGPRLVVVGDPALTGLARPTATIDLMPFAALRELWRRVRPVPVLPWYRRLGRRRPEAEPDRDLDELCHALFRRPRAVIAIAEAISRPSSGVTFPRLLAQLRDGRPGALEEMWQTILENVRAVLSSDADALLTALATLPVTGLIEGAATAMLGAGGPDALKELQNHNLVEQVDGRYRLPREYRRAIENITPEQDRRATEASALPGLSRFYQTITEQWATRLESEPERAQRWFKESEPSFRPLYAARYPDELAHTILDDLHSIADALTRWYLRTQQPDLLLTVHRGLHTLARGVESWEIAARAAIRQATAHRMAGVHGRTTRFDDAASALDTARDHCAQVPNPTARAELDAREQVERALLAIDRGTGLDEAFTEVSKLGVESPAVLINLGVLHLGRGELPEARDHLQRAKDLAEAAEDQGAWAHSVELEGVVLAHDDLAKAVELWLRARAAFARIGERQGEARCLQHLGAAALAGQPWTDSEPIPEQDAATMAVEYLAESKKLRPRQQTALADECLELARRRLE